MFQKLTKVKSDHISKLIRLSNCDYNVTFFKKDKQRRFNILRKDKDYQDAFNRFGELQLFNDTEISIPFRN